MSIESLISESGQMADITVEAPDGQVVGQDPIGGAIRSGAWPTVVQGVACLVRPMADKLSAYPGRSDARADVWDTQIYFFADPVPSGISTRHRITVRYKGTGGWNVLGVYAVQGVINPNTQSRIFQVGCERIRVSP